MDHAMNAIVNKITFAVEIRHRYAISTSDIWGEKQVKKSRFLLLLKVA